VNNIGSPTSQLSKYLVGAVWTLETRSNLFATKLTPFVAHARKLRGMQFQENSLNASSCTLLQVRCSSLLIDRNQTYTVCSARVEIARFEASAKSLELKPRYRRKDALLSEWCALPRWPLEPQRTPFIPHAREAQIEKFKENSSNRSRDTEQKVLCSTSFFFIIIRMNTII
jgi:hypothetical protein